MILLSGSENLNTETVLRTLPQVASLCRGNWVVRSDVLYPKDTFSSISGVPANIMCRARDYVVSFSSRTPEYRALTMVLSFAAIFIYPETIRGPTQSFICDKIADGRSERDIHWHRPAADEPRLGASVTD